MQGPEVVADSEGNYLVLDRSEMMNLDSHSAHPDQGQQMPADSRSWTNQLDQMLDFAGCLMTIYAHLK